MLQTKILWQAGNIGKGKIKFVGNINNSLNLEKNLLKVAASLEKNSEHPLAEAIVNKAEEENIGIESVTNFEAISGRGIKGLIDGIQYFGGNLAFMEENNIDTKYYLDKANELLNDGKIVLYFANTKEIMGLIAVSDVIKESSKDAVEELKKRNLEVIMLTGDNEIVAKNIAKEAGIEKVISNVLPR